MNIIVKTYGNGRYICRPDTTWEREDKDLFSPGCIAAYHFSPVLFARVCKAGKCVGRKFASRYYDSIGYGILLYPSDMLDGSPLSYASASCIDHTSVLPFPMYNRLTLESGTNEFTVIKDGMTVCSTSGGSSEMIEGAVSDASSLTTLRIGDMIAIELSEPAPLADSREKERHNIRGTFCGNALFGFDIVF